MIDFGTEDPVSVIKRLIDGHGVDCTIDAVWVNAQHAHGESAELDKDELKKNQKLVRQAARTPSRAATTGCPATN